MRMKIGPAGALLTCVLLCACGPSPSASSAAEAGSVSPDAAGPGYRVIEVLQAGKYTYVQVDRDGESLWAAAPRSEIEVGDDVVLPGGMMPMKDWHSETLNRTWDVVYFAGTLSKVGAEAPGSGHGRAAPKAEPAAFDYSSITVPEGGKTVADLYREKETLGGTPILVRGLVVKVSSQIMGKNWIHVRDGSGEPGVNDLTVTTVAIADVGDTVVVRGVLGRNVDFGAGYVFDVIVEDAGLTIE